MDHSTEPGKFPEEPPHSTTTMSNALVTEHDAHGRVHQLIQLSIGHPSDTAAMHRLGKTQELRRNFRSFSILGLASVVMATWVAVLGSVSFSLINGGLAGTVWMFVGMWVFTVPVTASLAEMGSM